MRWPTKEERERQALADTLEMLDAEMFEMADALEGPHGDGPDLDRARYSLELARQILWDLQKNVSQNEPISVVHPHQRIGTAEPVFRKVDPE